MIFKTSTSAYNMWVRPRLPVYDIGGGFERLHRHTIHISHYKVTRTRLREAQLDEW